MRKYYRLEGEEDEDGVNSEDDGAEAPDVDKMYQVKVKRAEYAA